MAEIIETAKNPGMAKKIETESVYFAKS